MPNFNKSTDFKLRSGNNPAFKQVGSSPAKQLLPKYNRYGDFFYEGDNLQQYEPATTYERHGEERIYETDPRYDTGVEGAEGPYGIYRSPGQKVRRIGEDKVIRQGDFGPEIEEKGSIKSIGFSEGNYARKHPDFKVRDRDIDITEDSEKGLIPEDVKRSMYRGRKNK